VFTLKITDRVGKLVATRGVGDPEEEILDISASGMIRATPAGAITQIGRQTQGVIVMRIPPDDQVVAIAPVAGIEEGAAKERPHMAGSSSHCWWRPASPSWSKARWRPCGAWGWPGEPPSSPSGCK